MRALVAATVFRELLKPLAAELGPAGDVTVDTLAERACRAALAARP